MAGADSEVRFKSVMVGSLGAGKTSVVQRFVKGRYDPGVTSTIGSSFLSANVMLDSGETVVLDVWDTSGQERYSSVAEIYFRAAQIGIIVFSLVDVASFEAVRTWVDRMRKSAPEGVVIGIAGNKLDLAEGSGRAIPREAAVEYAESVGATYLETSALTAEGVADLFKALAERVPRSTMARRRTKGVVVDAAPADGGCQC